MATIPASDSVVKGADGLTPTRSHIVTQLDKAAVPYIPSAEQQAEQRAEQPGIGFDPEALEAERRAAVEKLGYGRTR